MEYVRRVNANGAVMVIAVTEEGELLLVEEYRFPLHARTIGLPAGFPGTAERKAPWNPRAGSWKRKPDTALPSGPIYLPGLPPPD